MSGSNAPLAQAGWALEPWAVYVALTIACWGVYGPLLHSGQLEMKDADWGRYKAFLLVGVAYFLAAVLAPAAILAVGKAAWSFPMSGVAWSLAAGVAGAVGALGVLLAFGAGGKPAVVMSLVFAGAPIVNAFAALAVARASVELSALRWEFLLGVVLAAVGGALVTLYRPMPPPHGAPLPKASPPATAPVEP